MWVDDRDAMWCQATRDAESYSCTCEPTSLPSFVKRSDSELQLCQNPISIFQCAYHLFVSCVAVSFRGLWIVMPFFLYVGVFKLWCPSPTAEAHSFELGMIVYEGCWFLMLKI